MSWVQALSGIGLGARMVLLATLIQNAGLPLVPPRFSEKPSLALVLLVMIVLLRWNSDGFTHATTVNCNGRNDGESATATRSACPPGNENACPVWPAAKVTLPLVVPGLRPVASPALPSPDHWLTSVGMSATELPE